MNECGLKKLYVIFWVDPLHFKVPFAQIMDTKMNVWPFFIIFLTNGKKNGESILVLLLYVYIVFAKIATHC
jgi:hypothetical protein